MAKRRVLAVQLSGGLAETPARFSWARGERTSLYDVESALRRARDDDGIRGLLLEVRDGNIGWSQGQSLHREIGELRARGKTTVAFLTATDNVTYMMATACETVVLAPSTILMLQSLASESFFFKDLLGDLGFSPELDAVGEFKSVGESLVRRESSEEHRSEMQSILEDMNDQLVSLIATARAMTPDAVSAAIATGPFLATDAKRNRLVDHVEHEEFCRAFLEERLDGTPKMVPHAVYAPPPGLLRRAYRWRRPQVAVVHACGVLTSGDGKSPPSGSVTTGAHPFSELLRKLRERKRVKAVVLRIDSPGGGAVASDIIHRELALMGSVKPVIVSMGDTAASGGYYIASAARVVLAEGASLTGSIGVIGGKIVVKRLLDRLGIARESIALGANAGMFSPLRSFTAKERDWHRRHLEHFYRERFLPVVAEGRKLTLEQVDDAGRGRVWTGRQGREMGLVDALGGLHDAIDVARERAGLPEDTYRVVVYGRRARLRELFSFGLWERSFLTELAERFSILEALAREELLLLMPRMFRIR